MREYFQREADPEVPRLWDSTPDNIFQSGPEDPKTVMTRGVCFCYRSYFVFHPQARAMADILESALPDDTDIYIADEPEPICSCGMPISVELPSNSADNGLGIFR